MDSGDKAHIAAFLEQEYGAAEDAVRRSDFSAAWHHLERAHILAQMELGPHVPTGGCCGWHCARGTGVEPSASLSGLRWRRLATFRAACPSATPAVRT